VSRKTPPPPGRRWRGAGLVEAWAGGMSWSQATADCSIDEGDVARLLSRTVDLLRQVEWGNK
jgi:superfamily II RNA helicase